MNTTQKQQDVPHNLGDLEIIANLRSEIETLKQRLDNANNMLMGNSPIGIARSEIERLRYENARLGYQITELEKDKARLDFLNALPWSVNWDSFAYLYQAGLF